MEVKKQKEQQVVHLYV